MVRRLTQASDDSGFDEYGPGMWAMIVMLMLKITTDDVKHGFVHRGTKPPKQNQYV